MYLPADFRVDDPPRLHALIDAHPLAMVVAGPEIAHLPVLLDRHGALGSLRLHASRRNPIVLAGQPVTFVFAGPHGYVSPSWYEDPAGQVPTWNYAVVQASGQAQELEPAELRQLLTDLARRFEGPKGWSPTQTRPGFVEELLPEIIGFRVAITALQGKFKLSQNRSPADRARVRAALLSRGGERDREMVALMEP